MQENEIYGEFQLDVRIIPEAQWQSPTAAASEDCTNTCATLPNCFADAPSSK
ncbi:hypothetical protein ACIBFB_12170 [Nocardiopsis sp. NPDC050513]|uniref:hypothetical protein n=1 Tax=Nocardiopsis sp. NPDC050513 TaxID=3364338 RepID=UPI0037B09DC8